MIRPNIGIDTSVLVRLVTGQPPDLFTLCVETLSALSAADAEIFTSNQVIGQAYVALQHRYNVSKEDARTGLHTTLTSGLVAPLNGRAVLEALAASRAPSLLDRLITNDYARAGMDTLTLDHRMASLPQSPPSLTISFQPDYFMPSVIPRSPEGSRLPFARDPQPRPTLPNSSNPSPNA